MTFKIICTIENGKSKLSIIPSQWETKNILRWPRKCTDKMVQDEKSSPKPDWISMPCIVKRRNYLSYDSAEQELARMLNNTDTEQEDENYYTRQAQSKQNERNVDYNFMVQQLESEQENRLPLTTNDPIYFSDNTWKDMRNESVHINTTNILETKINDTEQIANIQTNTDLEGTILHNHKVLNDNQILMIDNQKKVMKKVAEISVKLDELLTKLNKNQHTTVTTLSASKFNENNEDLYMKEIENKEQLDNFEKSLEDNSYKTKAMKTYSIVCSKGKGINCAYKLLDVIFSRDFLCKCSWAGGSRSDDTKIPLKSYKNTLRFFFDMIHMWDPEFTIEANEGFFKSILKNAKKRKDVKFVRMPTQRKRESGKKCKKECIGVAGFDVTKANDTIKSQETVTNNTKKQTDNNMIKDMKDRDNNEEKSTQPTKQYKKSRFTVKHVANTITSLSQETVTKNTENQTENKNTKKMEIDKDNKREVLGQSSNQSSKEEQKARNMKEEKFGQSSKQFKKKEYITKESKEEKSSPSSKQSMKRRIPVQDVTNSIIAIHSQEVVPKNTENKKKEDKEKYYTEKERVQASKQPKKRRIAAKGMADIISISSQLQETEYQAENKKKDTDEDELDDEKKVEESDIEEKNKEDTDEDVLDDEEKIEESDLEETNNVDTDEEETYVAEERKEEKFGQSSKQFKKKEYITKESKEEKSSPSSKQSMKRRIPVQDVTNSIIAIHSQEVVPKNTENKKKEDKEKYYTEKERVQASKQPKKRRIAAKGMADIISISSQLQETEYQAENKKKDTDEDELDDEKKVEESDIEEKNKEDTDEDVLDDEEKIEESDLEETNNVDTDEEETYVAEERKEEIDEEEKIEESDEVDEADFN